MGSEGLLLVSNSHPLGLVSGTPALCSLNNKPEVLSVFSILLFSNFFNVVFFLKVAVTAVGAVLAEISMDLQSVQSTV